MSKLDRLDAPHVEPLNRLVRSWRNERPDRFVPWFDPDDAGTGARVLVLLEKPAPSTASLGEVAFSSEDNDNPSSRALRVARIESGLQRNQYVRWNAIPWIDPEQPRQAGDTAIELARGALHSLLAALPRLRVIVPLGTVALNATMRYFTLTNVPLIVPVIGAPHPSPANGAHRHEQHQRMTNAFRHAARIASER